MPLWKITLSYDGSPFHGWQIQPGLRTVQGELAEALFRISGERVLPQGSGRTDAGVHALAQVTSFSLASPIPPANLLRALNRVLPRSIRVLAAEHASPPFHARHSARRKTYEYRIFPRREIVLQSSPRETPGPERICSPMVAPFVWDCPLRLSLSHLEHAAKAILGLHDFTSFAAAGPDLPPAVPADPMPDYPSAPPTPCRTIYDSRWQIAEGLLLYRVTGSGFLHHMVRNLVGTFTEIGAGRVERDAIPSILAARDRSAAGPTAPARGLFLVQVEY